MQKDYYYLKEVLLGLKDEYVKMDEELKKLKQLAIVTNPTKIKNFYFWLFQYLNNEIELKCVVEREKNQLQKFIEEQQKKTGRFIYGRDDSACNINEDGTFAIKEKDFLISGLTSEFVQQVRKILSSDFTNGICKNKISTINDNYNSFIEIDHTFIRYLYSSDVKHHTSLEYMPAQSNELYFNNYDGLYDKKMLLDILYSRYLRSDFSEYQQRIIDANPSTIKPIEILDIPTQLDSYGYLSETIELEEQKSVVVLKKKIIK